MSSFKCSQDFVFKKLPESLTLASVLPDVSEFYTFDGISAEILHRWLASKNVIIDKGHWERELNLSIPEKDWLSFLEFVQEKRILIKTA